MAYGLTGTGYALLLKARALEAGPVAAGRNSVFMETFDAFVLLFAAGFLLLSITRRLETPRTPRG